MTRANTKKLKLFKQALQQAVEEKSQTQGFDKFISTMQVEESYTQYLLISEITEKVSETLDPSDKESLDNYFKCQRQMSAYQKNLVMGMKALGITLAQRSIGKADKEDEDSQDHFAEALKSLME